MPYIFNIDHKIVLGTSLAVTASVAAFSSWKLFRFRRLSKIENIYETQSKLNEYLVFHYGAGKDKLKWDDGPKSGLDFQQQCADLCLEYYEPQKDIPDRALDVGCAVGRAAFELSNTFQEVVGIDKSRSFIDACNQLKESGHMEYSIQDVGELSINLEAKIPENLDRQKTVFQVADACNLPLDLGNFGCVLAANVICHLRTPQFFLQRLNNLVAPGGILVITSSYSCKESITPKKYWIGGFVKDGREFTGFDGLKEHLGKTFDLICERDLQCLFRQTSRKHQWNVCHATVWRRRR